MRTKLLVLAASVLLFVQCKKNGGDDSNNNDAKVIDVATMLSTTESKFLEFGTQSNGTAKEALAMTYDWLRTQPNIKDAELRDSLVLNFELNSGLQGMFSISLVDNMGKPVFRGGGDGTASLKTTAGSVEIANKKVLIISPVIEFYTDAEIAHLRSIFSNSTKHFDVRIARGEAAHMRLLDSLSDYGLVIFDSHGYDDGIQMGGGFDPRFVNTEVELKAEVDEKNGAGTYDRILSGDIRLSTEINIRDRPASWVEIVHREWFNLVASAQLINKLPALPNTIIFANACNGGSTYTSPGRPIAIKTAFINRNPISYYFYGLNGGGSGAVSNAFAKTMEDSLITSLVIDFDSTGQAHRKYTNGEFRDPEGVNLLFKQEGHVEYSYDACAPTMTDPRDGTVYKTVCIGDQRWMAENLRYATPDSRCYNNDPIKCELYGRLYRYTDMMQGAAPSKAVPSGVQGVCPQGWHVPSIGEWQLLINRLGGMSSAARAMMAVSPLWANLDPNTTNSSGFSALPGGVEDTVLSGGTYFSQVGSVANFWTASDTTINAAHYFLGFSLSTAFAPGFTWVSTDTKMSCRCVMDK